MIQYIILIIIVVLLIATAYIKIKHRFWSMQPAFHVYDFWYWWFPAGVIKHDMPIVNQFVNRRSISTFESKYVSEDKKDEITEFIRKNYLNQKGAKYLPEKENIFPYFENLKGYISYYTGDGNIAPKGDMISVITSRPIYIYLGTNEIESNLVDFLCVAKGYRRKGIAEEMIQTHLANHGKLKTCFFKRETDLTLIVPVVMYSTYCFDMENWQLKKNNASYALVESSNLWVYFLSENRKRFKCYATPSLANLTYLIKTGNLRIFALVHGGKPIACYVFRKATTRYGEKETNQCIASIKSDACSDMVFCLGFSDCLSKMDYSILMIEDLADNHILIESIMKKYEPKFKSPTAYYFHNYATLPVKNTEVCLVI